MIALDADNIRRAFHALDGIGYRRPTVPIDADLEDIQHLRWLQESSDE